MEVSSIKDSFDGKSVLITGGSGFIGKCLTEKLLRDCNEIEKIFLLFRSKRGNNLDKRFEKLQDHVLFRNLKQKNEKLLDKLQPIYGDLKIAKNAGISTEDLENLQKSVNFVIHCAASVRFNDSLKDAVTLNTIGTQTMLDLAETFHNLEAFVHVSTAYSNTNQAIIDEIIYEPILDYRKVIDACETNDLDVLQSMEKLVSSTFPNTYVFSKNLTEKLVSERKNLPWIIVRPSIVTPSYRELPGYCDSEFHGPIGILLGASLGILRSVHVNKSIVPDMIPVDICVNSIIAATSFVAHNPEPEMKVINCTSSAQTPITWGDFIELGRTACKKNPSINAIWYPGGRLCRFYVIYLLRFLFLQFLPSCLIDFMLLISGKKPKFVKIQQKIFTGLQYFSYFMNTTWIWKNGNLLKLYEGLNANDKRTFNFDTHIDYQIHARNWVSGVKRYIEKVPDDSTKEAKVKLRYLFVLDLFVTTIFYVITGYLFFRYFNFGDRHLLKCNSCATATIFNLKLNKVY